MKKFIVSILFLLFMTSFLAAKNCYEGCRLMQKCYVNGDRIHVKGQRDRIPRKAYTVYLCGMAFTAVNESDNCLWNVTEKDGTFFVGGKKCQP